MKKIVIFYPSEITGGAEFLLKTIADFLKKDYNLTIIDINDGWLSKNISDVNKIFIDKNKKIELDDNITLITTANLIRRLDEFFTGNFSLIGWNIQGFNMIPILPKLGTIQHFRIIRIFLKYTFLFTEYLYLKKLIKYLKYKNSLYIMDETCNDIFKKYYNISFNEYLPVVIPDEKFLLTKKIFNNLNNKINCVWLGRLDNEFKTPILNHLLINISEYAKNFNGKIIFNIIGNGPGLEITKNVANKIVNVEINFLLEKRDNELKDLLVKSDIGFAMGTSALEIAACNIPVVLLDASYRKVPDTYTYKWIYEEVNYNIGHMIDSYHISKFIKRNTLEQIMSELLFNYDEISVKSYEYVKNNHSVCVLKNKIIEAINKTTSNFEDMKYNNLFKDPYWNLLKPIINNLKKEK